MLKILLKKQFKELKYSYFKDKKTGKMMKTGKLVGLASLLGLCYVSFGFAFYGISVLFGETLKPANGMWLAFAMFALMTILLGTFINMFATKAIIYDAKDNELLMSLPIKEKDIVLSRLIVTYFQCLIYTSFIWLPIVLYYLISVEFSIPILLIGIVMLLLLTLLTTVLSCVFGYLVTLLSKCFKGKSYITTLITLGLLGGYYYFYFNIQKYLNNLVAHINQAESFFKTKGFPFYCVGKACVGNIGYLLIIVAASALSSYMCFLIINNNFSKLTRMHVSASTKKFESKETKQKSVSNALIGRELKHYLSNTTYTINAGLGVVILLACTIALLIFREKVNEFVELAKLIPVLRAMLPIVLFVTIAWIVSMDCLSTPAVSLEGKNYWIVRTLPVSTYDVLDAKRQLQFRMNVVPAVLLIVVATLIMGIGDIEQILLVFAVIAYTSFVSFFDLLLGIKGANLRWTSEVVPIKQAGNILIAIFGAFIISALMAAGYYFLFETISVEVYLCGLIVLLVLLVKLIDRWIRTKGVKQFESLG